MVQVGVESENHWRPAKAGADILEWITVPGTNVHLQVMKGWPSALLGAAAADVNAYIEPLRDADSASFTPTNSVATSNHLNGTAMDLNWNSHPFHVKDTFNPAQRQTIRELLDFYEGTIFWAGDWEDPIDEMHWQMGYDTWNNPATADFISRKIRPDGFSTFRRGDAPAVDVAQLLSEAMGSTTGVDYGALQPAVSQCLRECDCTSVERIAMWCAQIGTESVGLKYMEEIASGAEYEGRTDLGNTQPGDGVRFKGRGPIQVTGRHNYTVLSQWAFSKGLVPSPTYFVDLPHELASDRYGFIGVTWYWTTQRPMNDAADAKDVVTATHYVNGGEHGLQDRINRFNRCMAMGQRLLALVNGEDDMFTDDDRMLLRQIADIRRKSRSALRWPGEGEVDTCAGFAWSADGNAHVQLVERLAVEYGDPNSIAMLVAVAACQGDAKFPDRQDDAKLAARILAKVPADAKAVGTKQIQSWLDAETKAS